MKILPNICIDSGGEHLSHTAAWSVGLSRFIFGGCLSYDRRQKDPQDELIPVYRVARQQSSPAKALKGGKTAIRDKCGAIGGDGSQRGNWFPGGNSVNDRCFLALSEVVPDDRPYTSSNLACRPHPLAGGVKEGSAGQAVFSIGNHGGPEFSLQKCWPAGHLT